jgi:hypothetical protein
VDSDEKIRYCFAPSLEKTHAIDEVVHRDPERLKKGWIGWVNLSFEGETYTVMNNQSFARVLTDPGMAAISDYIGRGKIRWDYGAHPLKIHKTAWVKDLKVRVDEEEASSGRISTFL